MNTIQYLQQVTSTALADVSDTAKLDTQLLLAHALQKNITYLHTWPETALTAQQMTLFEQLVQRRLTGEPIAYILGMQEFWSLPFAVSPATLIPRPDTEVLVELVLTQHGDNTALRCLDLGTGTGAIALAIASEQPNWHIEAIDYNEDAVELAKKNAANLSLPQVTIYQSDWFSKVKRDTLFDVIVSNPPYIDADDLHLSQGDVRFEPNSALVAEQNGLSDIISIATKAKQYLTHGGSLYIEHGFEQGEAVRKVFTDLAYIAVVTSKDYGGNDRITSAKYVENT